MKAYVYLLTPDPDMCFGIVVNEYGRFLKAHIGNNRSQIRQDLASHAEGYEFEFVDSVPSEGFAISFLLNEIYRLKNELEEVKNVIR